MQPDETPTSSATLPRDLIAQGLMLNCQAPRP